MAYTAVPTVNTSDSWTAADHNTYIKDNLAYLKTAADTHVITLQVIPFGTNVTTGDAKFGFRVPAVMDGYVLSAAIVAVQYAGTTGTTDIQIRNVSKAQDMLSTKATIDSGEFSSYTAATPLVIDTAKDDVSTNDMIAIDVDAVSSTPPTGLYATLTFTKA